MAIALPPGDPEVSPRNRVLTNAVRAGLFTEGDPGTEIHQRRGAVHRDVIAVEDWLKGIAAQ